MKKSSWGPYSPQLNKIIDDLVAEGLLMACASLGALALRALGG